ncbi:hypothetical protein D4R51_01505 [bacterium]|nr:MAG: hypothetical protein D4R51_01505 [bacterium]
MRGILFEYIKKAIAENPNVFFITADVGFNLVEPMFEKFPERAMNIGIAEQNLVGVAAGLCNLGFKPIAYSYTNFLAERAFEQIRDDICLHHYAPVFVGTTTGFDGGILGPTHHAVDDMAGIKALPNMRIYSPSTSESMELILKEALAAEEASFIRFTKSELSENRKIEGINRFMIKNENAPVLVVSHGKMAQNCFKAAAAYPNFSLFAMDRIKPLDEKVTKELLKKYEKIVIVEDNFKSAGLFNSICQFAVENKIQGKEIVSLSPEEKYEERIGDASYLEDENNLSSEKINKFLQSLENKK